MPMKQETLESDVTQRLLEQTSSCCHCHVANDRRSVVQRSDRNAGNRVGTRDVVQETSVRVAESVRIQVDPSVVPTIPIPPTAVHSSIVKQEID